jgi:hypothetical protein
VNAETTSKPQKKSHPQQQQQQQQQENNNNNTQFLSPNSLRRHHSATLNANQSSSTGHEERERAHGLEFRLQRQFPAHDPLYNLSDDELLKLFQKVG